MENETRIQEPFNIEREISESDTERHRRCKPPKEAYYFFPDSFQIVEHDPKNPKKTLRRIFESKEEEYLPFEKEKLANLYQEIEKYNTNKSKNFKKLIIPDNWPQYETLRFHQATSYKNENTIKLLNDHFEWKSTFPFGITEKSMQLLNSGFMYVHGRDNNYRPIIVLNADVYVKLNGTYHYDDWLRCIIYFMEYAIHNLLIPGQVENWNIITDLGRVSLLSVPKDMKKFMGVLGANYRCRLYVNYIIGMGGFLLVIWNMIKAFLDEIQIKKLRFLKNGDLSDILTYINPEQVEERFGGSAKNVRENYFPPIMPSDKYLKPTDKKEKHFVTEEKYRELYINGKINKPSPYFLKEQEEEERNKKVIEMIVTEEKQKEHGDKMISEIETSHKINEKLRIKSDGMFFNLYY